jgi:Spy/CpxP family protein refolding chaperone
MTKFLLQTLVMGVIVFAAAASFAQSPQTNGPPASSGPPQNGQSQAAPGNSAPGSPAGDIANRMAAMLNMSDAQTMKVKSVLEEEHGKLIALRDDPSLSMDDKQAKLLVIQQTAADQIMNVLSPEQQQRLVQLLNDQQDNQEQED